MIPTSWNSCPCVNLSLWEWAGPSDLLLTKKWWVTFPNYSTEMMAPSSPSPPITSSLNSCSGGSQLPFCEMPHRQVHVVRSGRPSDQRPDARTGAMETDPDPVEPSDWAAGAGSWLWPWEDPEPEALPPGTPGSLSHRNQEIIGVCFRSHWVCRWFVTEQEITNIPCDLLKDTAPENLSPFSCNSKILPPYWIILASIKINAMLFSFSF